MMFSLLIFRKRTTISFLMMLLACFFIGCSNPLNKTINEELSIEDLKSIHKKDTLFVSFYELIRKNISNIMNSETQKVKYCDLTYKQLYKYVNTILDTSFIDLEAIIIQWDEKFPFAYNKMDSIIAHYNKFILDNSLSKYVKMEFVGYKKRQGRYGFLCDIGMNITPLNGEISEIYADIRFIPKKGVKNMDIHVCFEGSFSKSRTVYENVISDEFEEMCIFKDPNSIKEEYDIEYYISMAKYKGKYIFTPISTDKIPKPYIEYLQSIFNGKIPMDYEILSMKHNNIRSDDDSELISKMLYSDFVDIIDYSCEMYLQKSKEQNKKCFEFLCDIPGRNFYKWIDNHCIINDESTKEYIIKNSFF